MQMSVEAVCQPVYNMISRTFHFAGWLKSLCVRGARSCSVMKFSHGRKFPPPLYKTSLYLHHRGSLQQVRMLMRSMLMMPYSRSPTSCSKTLCGGFWRYSQRHILSRTREANGSPHLGES